MDSHRNLLLGGDTGPAIVPGDVEASLLIHSVRRTGDYEMPPEKPLSSEQVRILEAWIEDGAYWPEELETQTDEQHAWEHWAFQPIQKGPLPAVTATSGGSNPVDAFVRSKLQEKGLDLLPNADKRTLIRRVYYHLTGLPPSADEVQAFVNDNAPDTYERLVDRLLQSKEYGEQWARYWLDLARYADTKGYVYGFESSQFVHSANYRDWVVKAFCNDMPYDQFLLLQVAADQVAPDDAESQAAMGFLTLGRRFLGNEHDVIDDRLDVLGRTTMGVTFGCARCHDHKYDPISIEDYYSLYGVIGNSIEDMVPLTDLDELPANLKSEYEARLNAYKETFQKYADIAAERLRNRIGDYLMAQLDLSNHPNIPFSQILQDGDIYPAFVHQWDAYLRQAKRNNDPVFSIWHAFLGIDDADFETEARRLCEELPSWEKGRYLESIASRFSTPPMNKEDVVRRYSELFAEVIAYRNAQLSNAESTDGRVNESTISVSPTDRTVIENLLFNVGSPCLVPNENISGVGDYFPTSTDLHRIWEKQRELESWILSQKSQFRFAVRMIDRKEIEEPRVFKRGNPNSKGPEIARKLPAIMSLTSNSVGEITSEGEITKASPELFVIGSGRLELAQGIVDPRNPLTARVWANRIWQKLFERGIVPTASDFGLRSAKPAHSDLLDWLAASLLENGWSTKSIIRDIVCSDTYKQASASNKQPSAPNTQVNVSNAHAHRETASREAIAEEMDPQNDLFWKRLPHRLTFEEYRDSLLHATGDIDRSITLSSGPLFTSADTNLHRSLYGFIDRASLHDAYSVFDFANPDMHVPQRSETTVSQQALFGLNHPFLAARAKSLIKKIDNMQSTDEVELTPESKVTALFMSVLKRLPTELELEKSLEFIFAEKGHSGETDARSDQMEVAKRAAAWSYGYGKLDPELGTISDFNTFGTFSKGTWQGGPTVPDPKTGWGFLTSTGGHPGNDLEHAVVRRWTAAETGTVSIRSTAKHEPSVGNGARFWVSSNRHGLHHRVELFHSSSDVNFNSIELQSGDFLDFIVDINGELNSDQFLWEIEISRVADVPNEKAENVLTETALSGAWHSAKDFHGPQPEYLTRWEQLAQVLFLSNEFYFVP